MMRATEETVVLRLDKGKLGVGSSVQSRKLRIGTKRTEGVMKPSDGLLTGLRFFLLSSVRAGQRKAQAHKLIKMK